ncbi:transketolase [Candidatus Gottesmanbacteria bacterium]|nr:transketolase [Candidatus Gottesmanbacteria bacterium]
MDTQTLTKLAKLIRYFILVSTTAAGSGHATSSLSAVELMTMLYFKYLHYDLLHPDNPANDRVIFSKGHASPLFYALYAAAGRLSQEDLLQYRTFGSNLEGHPTSRFLFTEAATGSLGQGLSVGVGEALAFQARISNFKFQISNLQHVYVLLGDGEMAEGEVWEALAWAAHRRLTNLTAVIDVNRLGQSGETMYGHDTEVYRRKLEAFGWGAIVIDGHDFSEIDAAYQKALDYKAGPVAIIAKTVKGRGVSFLEDKNGWHGKALSKEELAKALVELGEVDKKIRGIIAGAEVASSNARVLRSSAIASAPSAQGSHLPKLPALTYDPQNPVATRKAFGNALVRLAQAYPNMVVLDGDVQNSTYTELFAKQFPNRFFECFIAEQNMVGVALGLSRRGWSPWVSTFACFLTRAFDQIRMSAISGATIRFNGSHAGVSIGQDGPSQMGLEDIALFRSVHGSTVLYPADPFATERLVEEMMQRSGISYIRTTRPETPVLYTKDDQFPIGGSRVFDTVSPVMTVVAAGITIHEALKAQKQLRQELISIRVIDCYCVKPIDTATLKKAASETKAIIVVEDHYPEGGLGEAVKSALFSTLDTGNQTIKPDQLIHLAVSKMPRSGKPEELLDFEGIGAKDIMETIKNFLKKG